MIRSFTPFVLFLYSHAGTYGNNIQVSNVQLVGQNTAANTYQVQFDLSWENSWRTSTLESNWDAAWVFIKFSKLDVDVWNHARLNITGGVASSGATMQVVDNADAPGIGVGAFIYRSADGIGNVNFTGLQLQWNYDGTDILDSDLVEVCVQAIEMVYVPQGAFFLGDGDGGSVGGFQAGSTAQPYFVTTDATPLTLGGGTPGSIGNNNTAGQSFVVDDFNNTTSVTLPAAFPLGYDAFYCMKYEISQGQYAEHLSKLTTAQAQAHYVNPPGTYQNTIARNGSDNKFIYTASVPSRAWVLVSWLDLLAYLDWAGLRPMSETEFEKACRGTRYHVSGEFAWGTAYVSQLPYTVTGSNTDSASVSIAPAGLGNCYWGPSMDPTIPQGPTRCGVFAGSPGAVGREGTGASYWGIMELTGNMAELCVNVSSPNGRTYSGWHGNGTLTTNGTANVPGWPINTPNGSGWRGGGYTAYDAKELRTSSRRYINLHYNSPRVEPGGRGVRTAP